jgi:hypothetical protein
MIKVEGRDLWRSGNRIGHVGDGYIIDHSGTRVGTYTSDQVHDRTGRKVAEVSGDYIFFSDGSPKIRIEDNNRDVVGGSLNNVQKAAARVLLGE